MNEIRLIGRLGKDPEQQTYGSEGKSLLRFSIATTKNYKDSNGDWQKKASWHNVTLFGGNAKYAFKCNLSKGDLVFVGGSIQSGSYQKSDGTTVYTYQIEVDTFVMLSKSDAKKQPEESGGWEGAKGKPDPGARAQPSRLIPSLPEDDLPF